MSNSTLKVSAFALAAALCLSASLAVSGSEKHIDGSARVIDGDTLDISGQHIRLYGIDAFEKKQTCTISGTVWPCGEYAKRAMLGVTTGKDVYCEGTQHDRYGRLIGKCSVGDTDLGAFMVKSGLALAYREYSLDYVDDEQLARKGSIGAWSGQFVVPWEWRKNKQ